MLDHFRAPLPANRRQEAAAPGLRAVPGRWCALYQGAMRGRRAPVPPLRCGTAFGVPPIRGAKRRASGNPKDVNGIILEYEAILTKYQEIIGFSKSDIPDFIDYLCKVGHKTDILTPKEFLLRREKK